jgi:hypothetical protein
MVVLSVGRQGIAYKVPRLVVTVIHVRPKDPPQVILEGHACAGLGRRQPARLWPILGTELAFM